MAIAVKEKYVIRFGRKNSGEVVKNYENFTTGEKTDVIVVPAPVIVDAVV